MNVLEKQCIHPSSVAGSRRRAAIAPTRSFALAIFAVIVGLATGHCVDPRAGTFQVVQRRTVAIPGVDAVQVFVGDVTSPGPHAEIRIVGRDGRVLAENLDAREGQRLRFGHRGRRYEVEIADFEDRLTSEDSAFLRLHMLDAIAGTASAPLDSVAQIAAGNDFACARLNDGTVRCWGLNSAGQLGDGTTDSRSIATAVSNVTSAVQITAGRSHACARLTDGTARCWGHNSNAQLGDGTTIDRVTAVEPTGLGPVAEIVAGSDHTCARGIDGSMKCWGGNASGQIGDGSSEMRPTAVSVRGVSNALLIAAGSNVSAALSTEGSIQTWGFSALGDPTAGQFRSEPGPGPTLAGVLQLCARQAMCARLMDGTVQCWGSNSSGEVGDGSVGFTSASASPVTGLAAVTHIACGHGLSCAVRMDGSVWCWGRNEFGQLGSQTAGECSLAGESFSCSRTAVAVPGLANAAEVAAGGTLVCARISDGSVRCWGSNFSGELGNGTFEDSLAPVTVMR